MRIVSALLLCAIFLLLGGMTHANTEKPALYDVQTRLYSGNRTIVISAPHMGDKPTVEYFINPNVKEDIELRGYVFAGPWVVDVDWQAHQSMPKVTISPR
jgi:hypothetical protein